MRIPNPLTLVILGATGDLYQNKLSIALFNLFSENLLPVKFNIIGFARRPLTDLEFRSFTQDAIEKKSKNHNQKKLTDFLKHVKYIQGNLENLESFKNLSTQLGIYDGKDKICSNKLFYLAVPPILYGSIFKNIHEAGLTIPCAPLVEDKITAWTRVLVEKPFGKNIIEARKLDWILGELFDESQIFRIDHYLAKKALQNILSFRFSDRRLESLWNNKNIKTIRIIFHEKNTVSGRGSFYDGIGALNDVGQNHMLQILALVAMENPVAMHGKDIHNAREAVLKKIKLKEQDTLIRGQYEGYLQESQVKTGSTTETFFRVVLEVNNKRWKGVRFELEAGKALDKSEVFIEVYFKKKKAPFIFPVSSEKKVYYDAYEKVFYDCLLGDQTIFVSTKEIMSEWAIVTKIIKLWKNLPLVIYRRGSKGKNIK